MTRKPTLLSLCICGGVALGYLTYPRITPIPVIDRPLPTAVTSSGTAPVYLDASKPDELARLLRACGVTDFVIEDTYNKHLDGGEVPMQIPSGQLTAEQLMQLINLQVPSLQCRVEDGCLTLSYNFSNSLYEESRGYWVGDLLTQSAALARVPGLEDWRLRYSVNASGSPADLEKQTLEQRSMKLSDLIRDTIAPGSDPEMTTPQQEPRLIFVAAPPEVHLQIANMLEVLRRIAEQPPAPR